MYYVFDIENFVKIENSVSTLITHGRMDGKANVKLAVQLFDMQKRECKFSNLHKWWRACLIYNMCDM